MRTLILLLAALVVATPATAQDGCTQNDPCPLEMDIDENGFAEAYSWNVTVGDWYTLRLLNLDVGTDGDPGHIVTEQAYSIHLEVPETLDEAHQTVHFSQVGDYVLTDDATGDTATIRVLDHDPGALEDIEGDGTEGRDDGDAGNTPQDKDTPGLPFAAGAVLLAGLALCRRR